jgi:hypothetical protein
LTGRNERIHSSSCFAALTVLAMTGMDDPALRSDTVAASYLSCGRSLFAGRRPKGLREPLEELTGQHPGCGGLCCELRNFPWVTGRPP